MIDDAPDDDTTPKPWLLERRTFHSKWVPVRRSHAEEGPAVFRTREAAETAGLALGHHLGWETRVVPNPAAQGEGQA